MNQNHSVTTLAEGYSPRWLLRIDHPRLPPGAVLCAKLLAVCWLLTGQVVYLRADVVSFVAPPVALARALPWMQLAILVQLIAVLTIVASRYVRSGCALLAGTIALLAALDQPSFSNNRVFCGAILGMLALSGETGLLPRLQAALVYLCAALDKLLAADWRSGVFLRSFATDLCSVGELWSPGWSPGAALPAACGLSEAMLAWSPAASLGSWLVIATELAIAVSYAARSRLCVPLAVAFHVALFVLTGGTFGIFFYAGVACVVLVLDVEHEPAPFDRAWPYYAIAAGLAGPWVRPWHALLLPVLLLALAWRRRRGQRLQVAQERQ